MKIAIAIVASAATVSCIHLFAQQDNTASPGNDSAKVTYAPAGGGFGDQAASHAWEMSAVTGELEGKLDSKMAKVGDRVVLKTTEKVQTSDGTIIPRGSRLVGHVTEVQPFDIEVGPGRIAIAFDHAEMKNGQSIAIYTLIRGVNTSVPLMTVPPEDDGGGMGMPVPAGSMVNGGRMDASHGGGAPGMATNDVDRASDNAVSDWRRDEANRGSMGSTAAQGGGVNAGTGAHGVAAARAIPHATGIRGVMLAGNSSSSGVLLAPLKDIQFENGTLIQLGVATGK